MYSLPRAANRTAHCSFCQQLPKPAASPSFLSDGYQASTEMHSTHIPIMTLSVSQLSVRDSENVSSGIRK